MARESYDLFDEQTQAIIFGNQPNAIQRMLDFDFLCRRKTPSVAAAVNPSSEGLVKVFFGKTEILIPEYRTISDAVKNHPLADVLINFASFRSAYQSTRDALSFDSIRTVAIIAEGVPERQTRELIALAKRSGKTIIGPATVGGIRAGAFKIGNTAGSMDNIISSRLYRPGSVGVVSKSGGLSNELFNIVSRNADGIFEGIAIGGDRFPGSTYLEHMLRFEDNPRIKFMVCLGEVGGTDEYELCKAISLGRIKKPVVAWVSGTCAKMFRTEVQFGHAGAASGRDEESADAKNKALKEAGAVVPRSFDDFGDRIREVFEKLSKSGEITPMDEPEVPEMPVPLNDAVAQGKVRRPTSFTCTISDERGEEPVYSGYPMTELVENGSGISDIIGLLWFKRKLSPKVARYLELVLVLTADHGPAVSGAHNSIVAARAGKDIVSSLASGLLTIGPRFGGAIDDAARYFKQAADSGRSPQEFVDEMKSKGILIPGIGHRIKSIHNPDKRVEALKAYSRENFNRSRYLDYALDVERITTQKKGSLILNVDGCIAVTFLDMMSSEGFTEEETDEIVRLGYLNALFVLGRSVGLIGHILDQYRLKEKLYRHPWDDILFMVDRKEK